MDIFSYFLWTNYIFTLPHLVYQDEGLLARVGGMRAPEVLVPGHFSPGTRALNQGGRGTELLLDR
jgi:hypothetical protein